MHDRRPLPRRARRMIVTAIAMLGAVAGLTGCALGPRPTLSSADLGEGSTTGQAPIDAVLKLLDQGGAGTTFTAAYDVTRTFGAVATTAKVTADPARRSVTVGTVRIITIKGTSTTCQFASAASCTPGADVARLSDTGVTTPEFYASAAARRLRRDATAITGPPTASTKDFAGHPATCVAVPLAAGTASFCALSAGIVAEQDDGAVHLVLTSFAPTVDEALFSTTSA